jgi:hypothetical protein
MNPASPRKFPRRFLAALSQRLRTFYAFLLTQYRTDAETLLRRAEAQQQDISPTTIQQ